MAAREFQIKAGDISRLKAALPLRAGWLGCILLSFFAGLFVWFFIDQINALADQKINRWAFAFNALFLAPLVIFLVARAITQGSILSWLKRYWQNNVIGHTVYCEVPDAETSEIEINIFSRGWRPAIIQSFPYGDRLTVCAPIGGWFAKKGIGKIYIDSQLFSSVFKISLIDMYYGDPGFKLVDILDRCFLLDIEETFGILEFIQQKKHGGIFSHTWRGIISSFLIDSDKKACQLWNLQNNHDELIKKMDVLQSEREIFLLELIDKLEKSKRFVASKQGLVIRIWAMNMLLEKIDLGDSSYAKWRAELAAAEAKLVEIQKQKQEKKKH